jgi:hypothetical protein
LPGPTPGTGARPIDLGAVARAAQIGCTMEEIAAVVGLARSSFYARLDADPELREAIDMGRNLYRVTLRRLQWQSAMAGNVTMLIFLGKQYLGQRDRPRRSTAPQRVWRSYWPKSAAVRRHDQCRRFQGATLIEWKPLISEP